MQIILIAFLLYFIYRFVYGFLIPVIKTAGHVKQQFNAMKDQMGADEQNQGQPFGNNEGVKFSGSDFLKNKSTSGKKGSKDDYIEFEEIRQ